MTVSSVKQLIHRLAKLPSHDGHEAPSHEVLHKIETALHPYLDLSLEAFAELLSKVKKPKPPKKTAEEKAAEKAAKVAEKEQAKLAKAAEKVAAKEAKAEAAVQLKAQKAADKIAAKEAAKHSKIAEKEAEKARKVEMAAQAKLAKAAEKEAQKASAAAEKTAAEGRLAKSVGRELQTLIETFPGGGVPKATVDEGLAKLKSLGKPQLMIVAKQLNADAGLNEESSKGKISKAIETSVLQSWKTSDNVAH